MPKAGKMKACLCCDKRLMTPKPGSRKGEGWCPEALRVCDILLKELKRER